MNLALRLACSGMLLLTIVGCSKRPAAAPAGASVPVAIQSAEPAITPTGRVAHGFASLPDRGDLIAYPRQPAKHDGAYTWHRTDLSEAHALNAMADGSLRVTTPSGETLVVRYDHHIEHASGDWTWIGHIPGQDGEQTILTFGAHAAFGSIAQPGKPPLRLTVRNGVSWLVETDPTKVAGIINAATRPQHPDYIIPPKSGVPNSNALPTTSTPSMASAPVMAAATTSAAATVDLVLGYTPAFASDNGGQSGAITRLNYLVDVTNISYTNSNINARVRLVATVPVSYPDNTSNDTTLDQLTGYDSSKNTTTSPNSAFSGLRAAREQYGADLVSMVRSFHDPENGGCGVGWLIGGGQQGISTSDSYYGYSVVSDGTDAGTDGHTYFCLDETLAHELGHNMGANHDVAAAKGTDGVLDSGDYGAYAYSFGYKNAANAFYTIMAYGDTGQHIYRIFSDPRSTFCGGAACGTSQADNAMTLTRTIPTVATFRATVVANAISPRLDINADGRSDIFWSSPPRGLADWWLMNGTQWAYGGGQSVASRYHVVGRGDFDGDGRGDVLWTDGAALYIWHSLAAGGFSVQFLANYPSGGWSVAGVGDLNADGRDDIFWSNPSRNSADWWLMNGTHWTYGGGKYVNGTYGVAALGDFDGDGHSDVLWTDGATLYIWHSEATGGFSIQFLATYPTGGWSIGGVGDLNADGRDDIFWSNRTRGAADSWLMDGTAWSYGGVKAVGTQYRVIGLADFDGDARADVLWTDSSTLWIWRSLSTGSFQSQFLANQPSGWTPLL